VGLTGSAAALQPEWLFAGTTTSAATLLHPFVASHPEAVFVVRTAVASKTAATAKLAVGAALGQQLFSGNDSGGLSASTRFALKPNLTCLGGTATTARLGIVTDPDFVEGLIEGIKSGGASGRQIYMREGNLLADGYCPSNEALAWYGPIAERTGAMLTRFDSGRDMTARGVARANLEEGSEVIWRDVPDGVIFRRIGYLAPVNADDAFNLNIAKFKAHGMGLTLTSKNWQGTNISPYVHYCSSVPGQINDGLPRDHLNPNYREDVTALHQRHLEGGVPRWDRPGTIDNWNSGAGMETWVQKTLDNHAASTPGLHIIEGIFGRDGNWMDGPHGGASKDFMTNVVIFGANPFLVDIIGHWMGGHEPGNVGLFHSALDRGLVDRLDPSTIPLYDWNDGIPQLSDLQDFTRTPLQTYYLQRDYAGQSESRWHLLDEPFQYPVVTAVAETESRPQVMALGQNYPNPFNAQTMIEYRLPRGGNARVEIYDNIGQRITVLVDGTHAAGAHTVGWDARHQASGTYYYRLLTNGFQETRKMVLLR